MIIRITQDKLDKGYRIQLADGLNRTVAIMESRRFRKPSDARHDARKLFGPLTWQEPIAAGCQLDFVTVESRKDHKTLRDAKARVDFLARTQNQDPINDAELWSA